MTSRIPPKLTSPVRPPATRPSSPKRLASKPEAGRDAARARASSGNTQGVGGLTKAVVRFGPDSAGPRKDVDNPSLRELITQDEYTDPPHQKLPPPAPPGVKKPRRKGPAGGKRRPTQAKPPEPSSPKRPRPKVPAPPTGAGSPGGVLTQNGPDPTDVGHANALGDKGSSSGRPTK